MTDYINYNNTRNALNNLITTKENEINTLNEEISKLKSTLNMVDRQFMAEFNNENKGGQNDKKRYF